MCMRENACVYVRYVCARCLGKPGDGAESSSTVVIVSCGFWEPKAGPLQRRANALIPELCLQPKESAKTANCCR